MHTRARTSLKMCCLSSGLLEQHLPRSKPARQDVWSCSKASTCVSSASTVPAGGPPVCPASKGLTHQDLGPCGPMCRQTEPLAPCANKQGMAGLHMQKQRASHMSVPSMQHAGLLHRHVSPTKASLRICLVVLPARRCCTAVCYTGKGLGRAASSITCACTCPIHRQEGGADVRNPLCCSPFGVGSNGLTHTGGLLIKNERGTEENQKVKSVRCTTYLQWPHTHERCWSLGGSSRQPSTPVHK